MKLLMQLMYSEQTLVLPGVPQDFGHLGHCICHSVCRLFIFTCKAYATSKIVTEAKHGCYVVTLTNRALGDIFGNLGAHHLKTSCTKEDEKQANIWAKMVRMHRAHIQHVVKCICASNGPSEENDFLSTLPCPHKSMRSTQSHVLLKTWAKKNTQTQLDRALSRGTTQKNRLRRANAHLDSGYVLSLGRTRSPPLLAFSSAEFIE